jgi:hypothetical protein
MYFELCLVCGIFGHSSKMYLILAQKMAISFATIDVFLHFSRFDVVLDNPCKKYPGFFCED